MCAPCCQPRCGEVFALSQPSPQLFPFLFSSGTPPFGLELLARVKTLHIPQWEQSDYFHYGTVWEIFTPECPWHQQIQSASIHWDDLTACLTRVCILSSWIAIFIVKKKRKKNPDNFFSSFSSLLPFKDYLKIDTRKRKRRPPDSNGTNTPG